MRPSKATIAWLITVILGISAGCTGGSLKIGSVYCENREDPAGVPLTGLRFSWKLESWERIMM
jgi:hypothetical protein